MALSAQATQVIEAAHEAAKGRRALGLCCVRVFCVVLCWG